MLMPNFLNVCKKSNVVTFIYFKLLYLMVSSLTCLGHFRLVFDADKNWTHKHLKNNDENNFQVVNFLYGFIRVGSTVSVTRKKSPNVYKSCPKNDFTRKIIDFDICTKIA